MNRTILTSGKPVESGRRLGKNMKDSTGNRDSINNKYVGFAVVLKRMSKWPTWP